MRNANVAIIGGGVVGLSIFANLTFIEKNVFLFEKNSKICTETSARNSGVIHSGIHYEPGSLKAQLGVKGNRMIYEICAKNYLNCKKIGKITLASGEEEIKKLMKLYQNGLVNGVEGMMILHDDEIKNFEAGVESEVALYTPTSGIIEPMDLCNYYYSIGLNNGGTIITKTEISSIRKNEDSYLISGYSNGHSFEIAVGAVINSSGLYADKVAASAGFNISSLGYKIRYVKGDYFRIENTKPVKMLVYPVPEDDGLGIHMTPDISGTVRLGPNAYEVEELDYKVETSAEIFINSVKKYYPRIVNQKIVPDFSGIRPKLKRTSEFNDFIIKEESKNGYQNFYNLIGIESPGVTASPAIGEYVRDLYKNVNY